MPFRSVKQRKFLWANYPKLARRWTKKYGSKVRRKASRTFRRKRR